MQDIPVEYIVRAGTQKVADFFSEKMMSKFMSGYVPVFLDDFVTSFIFVQCDRHGYPQRRYHQFLSFLSFPTMAFSENSSPIGLESTVIKKEIEIGSPLVVMTVGFDERFIFMWEGRTVSQKEVPMEKMSVKELQQMSQEIIQKRNDSVMDEAFINRFII